ncbi:MAG: hypothetical protein V4721_10545 [Bacteroidota bacterium]
MTNSKLPRCLLRESDSLRQHLLTKWKGKRQMAILKDANDNGIHFTAASLSRYIKSGNVKGSLTAEHLIYLADKYGIEIKLKVKHKRTKANGT